MTRPRAKELEAEATELYDSATPDPDRPSEIIAELRRKARLAARRMRLGKPSGGECAWCGGPSLGEFCSDYCRTQGEYADAF